MNHSQQRTALLLCGGASRRMGQSKASLRFGNQTLLERTVLTLEPLVNRVILVAGVHQTIPSAVLSNPQVTLTRDTHSHEGPLMGLSHGLAVMPEDCDAFFLCGCDAPFLQPMILEMLFDQLNRHEADAVIPVTADFPHPLCAVYRRGIEPVVNWLLQSNERRMRTLLSQINTVNLTDEMLRVHDPDLVSLLNLNHWDDYLNALKLAGLPIPVPDDVNSP